MELLDPVMLADRARRAGAVLVLGPSGRGKSTLVTAIADALGGCEAVGADPGQPIFGPPGAVSRARRGTGEWRVERTEALCTLDAGRHRLALVLAVGRLCRDQGGSVLLIDAPGLVRGAPAAELLSGLVQQTGAQEAWLLGHPEDDELDALAPVLRVTGARVLRLRASEHAVRFSTAARRERRTSAWDRFLDGAPEHRVPLDRPVSGRLEVGRQIALLAQDRSTLTIGEIVGLEVGAVRVRAPNLDPRSVRALLTRDATRLADGLSTAPEPSGDRSPDVERSREPITLELPYAGSRSGTLHAELVNPLFDDPLVHVRLLHQKRSLLLDLGEPLGLSTRLANQVSDVFVTHAHMDHWSGFLWLVRRRVGNLVPCRIYGPPELAERVQMFTHAWTWDRIGELGPRFEVHEVHADRIRRFAVQAGRPGPEPLDERPLDGGALLTEPRFRVRAVSLDHGGTPVLAFAVEEAQRLAVRKDALERRALRPGRWIGELKDRFAAGQLDASLMVPGAGPQRVDQLAAELLVVSPGLRFAYATDLADTPENRDALATLARGVDMLVCEASFVAADADRARDTGHLTTTACAAIAEQAEVRWLVPFHFSMRYEHDPAVVFDEVRRAFPRTWLPRAMRRYFGPVSG